MMDDNSEAQMETDVSSTTVDVEEIREKTEISGNMTTVIVVEELQEDQTISEVQGQDDAEEAAPSVCVQSTEGSDNLALNESALSQNDEEKIPKVEGEKLIENQNINQEEKLNTSPSKVNQVAHTSSDISPKAVSSPVPMQSLEVIPDSSSKDTNKDMEISEKENQLEENATVDDHQYATKDTPVQIEQCDQKNLEQESVIEDTNMDKKEENMNSIENEPISKMDVGPISLDDSIDESNDSQMETGSDRGKERSKSISRELKSLIKSAKESKIISECTQLTSKTRKSRTPLDSSLVEAEKIPGTRRNSTNSQKSNCSEKSDKTVKRSMRSQNPEFVNKVKQFLNSVTGKNVKTDSETMSDDEIELNKSKESLNDSTSSTPKKKRMVEVQPTDKANKLRSDPYCWRCHWAVEQPANEKTHHPMQCTVCPRTFHFKCLSGTEKNKINTEKNWVCPECLLVLHAESSETRSPAMKKVTLGALCELLQYALERMMDLNGVEPFMHPVDRAAFPDYDKYVVHPMDLSLMKNNITEGLYGSTEAFIADAQWILHNSIIFNTLQSKLTGGARALVRSCRAEMGEIEACPECYAAAHARRPTWFTDVCTTPHVLLWAKLKGFPHWPAKGMSVNSSGLVDVRFFGAHDRAWVPAKDCYLYSEKDPNNFRTKRQDIIDSMQEAEQHIRNISRKYGKFVYPPFKTQFEPTKLAEQIKMMIPTFEGEVRPMTREKSVSTPHGKDKSRSNSKSSKSSINDGDMSEGEDSVLEPTRKMADGAEIAKEGDDFSISDKNKSTESNENLLKRRETSRKRRRSDLEEAVITILESSGWGMGDKCRRVDDLETDANKRNEDLKEKSHIVEGSIEQVERAAELLNKEKTIKEKEPSTDPNDTEKSVDTTPAKSSRAKSLTRTSTPRAESKDKNNTESVSTPKQKPVRNDKASVEKDEKTKTHKRRNSKHFKSANGSIEKSDKNSGKTTEKSTDSPISSKEKKDTNTTNKNKETESIRNPKKCIVPVKVTSDSPKMKDRKQIDDDTVLAELARETTHNIIGNSASGLPTISSVRSLSVTSNNTSPNPNSKSKTIEVTIESDVSVFTPTSTDTIRNVKEAANKLQKLRDDPPLVGRVGVRAFARMTSPEKRPEPMQVEIKSEPMDIDDSDRQSEKMDLMKAFKLRPVIQNVSNNLRDVRINKVVVAPVNAKKTAPKQPEMRVRAKKTFPQPKKADDGRSELNGKNSMVYIPIQPPVSQAPVRGARPISVNGPPSTPRIPAPTITSGSGINTVTSPLVPHSLASSNSVPTTTATSTVLSMPSGLPTVGQLPSGIPTVGQVPTNVHTVPLITSVNGQWTFSLQPVMSVGGVDDSPVPIVNGIADRNQMTLPSQLAHLSALPSPALPNTSTSASASASPCVSASASASATAKPLPATGNRNDTPAELPRLQQRPLLNPLDASTPMGCVPPPSTAGPLTAKLNQNAVKLTDFFRTLLEDSLEKIDEPASQLTSTKLQLEQARWRHQQEIDEIKHNHELVLAEMRASFEKEKIRAVNEVRRASQVELEAAVKLAKSKQWCAICSQEAQFYCCWNTSYCDYACQRAHWSQHYAVCTQQRNQDSNNTENGGPPHDNANQPPDNLPKSTQAPALTVGNKLAPLRVFQEPPNGQKSSIIVSMVEDSSGNQTMKCVGTYKPNAPPQLSSPLNINKQMISNDENPKKVVTSGGYLIVGAGSASGGSIVTSRRPHTIQYYT